MTRVRFAPAPTGFLQIRDFSTESNVKAGLIISASRAALTGQPGGPSAFAIFGVLGKERVVERLRRV